MVVAVLLEKMVEEDARQWWDFLLISYVFEVQGLRLS